MAAYIVTIGEGMMEIPLSIWAPDSTEAVATVVASLGRETRIIDVCRLPDHANMQTSGGPIREELIPIAQRF